jgi:hypothetical protein
MLGDYVGTAAVKAILRVVGTIAGAIVGVWLVGNYTFTPIVFLPVLFVVMAYSTYQFGHFGLRQFPYTYFLLGVTTLVIATDGIAAPDQAWQLGLYRTEEILAGVISALLVSSILWPRYAREEFVITAREALGSVAPVLLDQNRTGADGVTTANLREIRARLAGKLTALTNLRHAGARESSIFSAQLPSYDAYLVSLISVFDAALYLAEWPLTGSFVDQLRNELEGVYRGLVEEIRILSAPDVPGERLPASSLNAAFAEVDQKVEKLRAQGLLLAEPIAVSVRFGSSFAALRSLREELNNLRSITERLPRVGQVQPKPILGSRSQPAIDWFWVRIGIKGGACRGDCYHPPEVDTPARCSGYTADGMATGDQCSRLPPSWGQRGLSRISKRVSRLPRIRRLRSRASGSNTASGQLPRNESGAVFHFVWFRVRNSEDFRN